MKRTYLKDLIETRTRLVASMREIADNPQGEGGDLSSEQETRFEQCKSELSSLERRIELQQLIADTERRVHGEQLTTPRRIGANHELRAVGEFLQHVAAVGNPGSAFSQRAASGQNEGTPSDGGFLVNTDFSTSLLNDVWGMSRVAPLVKRMTVSSGANGIDLALIDETSRVDGSRFGGAAAYWVAEAAQITSSKVKFRTVSMKLNKLAALYYATDELLQDAPMLAMALRNFYASEISFVLDDCIINGTGAGQPLGILNSDSLVTISKESGQSADTILYENVVKMWSRLWPRGRGNAVWMTGPGVETQLYTMSITVGVGGGACFLPSGGASATPYSTLFGRPIIPVEQCPKLGDKGDIMLIDPTQYVLVDKGGINEASSIGVRFEYGETAFRAVYRCDGQPTWASSVVQHNSTDTISPFVCLEAR